MDHQEMRLTSSSLRLHTLKESTILRKMLGRGVLLLIGVLVLLGATQADGLAAGSHVWTGNRSDAGDAPAMQASLPPAAIDVTICDEVSEIPRSECEALVSLYQLSLIHI